MKFKVTKVAAAVATSLGVSAVGMNVARADAILFPYFAVSDTVTSLVTTINQAPQDGTASTVRPQTLHYRLYYKRGANADNLTAACEEFDVRRVSSPNDVVTFDLQARFGADTLGVVAEPPARQIKANYTAANQDFGLMRGLIPARGFLIVDNEESPNLPFERSLSGEILMIDFAEGAVWGYQAYNADPTPNRFSFQDAAENAGQVIAGNRAVQQAHYAALADAANPATAVVPAALASFPNGRRSPGVPTGILPIASPTTTGSVFTRFFVTPIGHSVDTIQKWIDPVLGPVNPGVRTPRQTSADPGQLQERLTTRIELTVSDRTGVVNDAVFDRDENPISGQVRQNVTCVGSVKVEELLSAGALREIGEFGGWSNVMISSPGPLVTFGTPAAPGLPAPITSRTLFTQEAVVIKLEYNPVGTFLEEQFPSSFNNAIWLRHGHRESIRGSVTGGLVQDRFVQQSAFDINGVPVDVAEDFVGSFIDVQTSFSQ